MTFDKKPQKGRALIACGVGGTSIVLATDWPSLAFDCGEMGNNCIDLGLNEPTEQGLWLWEGTSRIYCHGPSFEDSIEYGGKLRQVTMEELPELLAMEPPELCECGKLATKEYLGEPSCGSAKCELNMQKAHDYNNLAGNRDE